MSSCCVSICLLNFLIRWWPSEDSWIIVGNTFGIKFGPLPLILLLSNQLKSAGNNEILLLLVLLFVLTFIHLITERKSHLLLMIQLLALFSFLMLLLHPEHGISLFVFTVSSSFCEIQWLKKMI